MADERWRLDHNELGVLAMLALRGPQTVGELRARTERLMEPDGPTVDEALDTLVARSPEPFATRLDVEPGEREPRWAHLLGGEIDQESVDPPDGTGSIGRVDAAPAPASSSDRDLATEVDELRRRLDLLEEMLGLGPDDDPLSSPGQ